MKNNYYAVIMAGGIGSRFWPLSTQKYPKQFHDMLGTGESLIQRTFERINKLIPANNILIATNNSYEKLVSQQLPQLNYRQLLLEPVMRNTAPCILYAALKVYHQNPDAVMLIAPSDHWIKDESTFLEAIRTSFDACAGEDILMTLGIQPDHPNTGYGYIQFKESTSEIKKVKNFTEKPDSETAEQFLNRNDYLWNAGIFVWAAKSIIKAFKALLPEMINILDGDTNVYNTDSEDAFIKGNYEKCENISIDFGIMERAGNVHVLPADFGWNDLGTWGSLYSKLKKDENENAVVGANAVFRDAKGNMIRTENGKRVIIQGLEDFIVAERKDVIMICPIKDDQDIRKIMVEAEESFGKKYM